MILYFKFSQTVARVISSFAFSTLILCGLLPCGQAAAKEKTKRPNVIIFIADDMAWNDCGAYGNPKIRTPNIDLIAKQGVRFDSAFLTCSSCSPSRSSIMTGRYPHNTGAEQLHWPLPGQQITFVELLKTSGYYTASLGKWHLGPATRKKFHTIVPKFGKHWVDAVRNRPKDKPFFIWAAFTDPHRPYRKNLIPKPHSIDDVQVPKFLPDVKEVREDLALYYDEIANLDSVVGNVLKEIDRQGETENTMVLFMSDNGRPFPRCKTTVYDSGIKTPWIVKFPGRAKAGITTDSLVSSIDIAPTVVELAGLKPQKTFQGKSFLPILKDKNAITRKYIFAEHNWHDYTAHERAVRDQRYKYIENAYPQLNGSPPADAVRSITYQKMIQLHKQNKLTPEQQGCFLQPRPKVELYDLQNDPFELKNLADDAKHAKVLERMRDRLAQWRKETGDAVPKVTTPDEFDRFSGKKTTKGSRSPKPAQASGVGK